MRFSSELSQSLHVEGSSTHMHSHAIPVRTGQKVDMPARSFSECLPHAILWDNSKKEAPI
jgi:hypothetical protein